MNERIKELMTQVCIEQNLPVTLEHNSAYMLDAFAEKFAALIIEECADVINAHKYTDPDNFAKWILNQGIARGAHSIRDHFGD